MELVIVGETLGAMGREGGVSEGGREEGKRERQIVRRIYYHSLT